MKLFNYLFIIAFTFGIVSCGNDSPNTDEPETSLEVNNKFPSELVGTWEFYSGSPNSFFSEYEEGFLWNVSYTFVENGNLLESLTYPDVNKRGIEGQIQGNWYVENKKLRITLWNGTKIEDVFTYHLNDDKSMTLTIRGHSAIFYKHEDIIKFYPNLLIASWDNGRTDSGRERITFRSDGSGYGQSLYWEGRVFMSGTTFNWSYADESITAVYNNVASSIATKNYKIKYLNKKSLSWTVDNGSSYWLRD